MWRYKLAAEGHDQTMGLKKKRKGIEFILFFSAVDCQAKGLCKGAVIWLENT